MRVRPVYKVTVYCSKSAQDSLMPLLTELRRMGNWGSSRKIHIEHWSEKSDFYFDGDGSDKIYRMEVHRSWSQTKWRGFQFGWRWRRDQLVSAIRILRYGKPKTLASVTEETIQRNPK